MAHTDMSISVMKQALEALNIIKSSCSEGRMAHAENEAAIAEYILRQAIAEAEDAVAAEREIRARGAPDLARVGEVGVWGHKREWVGLTDEDLASCKSDEFVVFARAIEAKLKEKNA